MLYEVITTIVDDQASAMSHAQSLHLTRQGDHLAGGCLLEAQLQQAHSLPQHRRGLLDAARGGAAVADDGVDALRERESQGALLLGVVADGRS